MKYYFKTLFLSIAYVSFCYSNPLNYFKDNDIRLQFENELSEDSSDDPYQFNRQKLVKIGLSALLPGLGHFYSGQHKVGAIYSTIEIAGWVGRNEYLSRAEDSSSWEINPR